MTTRYAVLGLGEAGRTFAAGLSRRAVVAGWDPLISEPIPGIEVASSAEFAVAGADAILAFTTAAHSDEALAGVVGLAARGTVYADFATAGPQDKRRLDAVASAAGLRFVDAAIMAPVRRGIEAAPVLLCGDAAAQLGRLLSADGLLVEVLDGPPGSAAARKLLRSMLVKGLTGVLIESLRAAEGEGLLDWFAAHASQTLSELQPETLAGFLDGTRRHSIRRVEEMDAAADMAEAQGGDAAITRAVAALLRTVDDGGIPEAGALA